MPLVEMWKENFQKLLNIPTTVENVYLKSETLKAVVSIVRAFPKETEFLVLGFSNLNF
jgi:hypothetical protein